MIQLLKSGWLRSFVSTEARILQQPHLLSSDYFHLNRPSRAVTVKVPLWVSAGVLGLVPSLRFFS
ncbi:hypothetical protein AWU82_28095 [Pseudomonas glycinae]|uniref:Uncharacterized protein n=1 Tax=Pseudomonas glycinae TaxID=1785145 RepID=A0ABM6QHB8_9PSED|nr:hypothetical protein AWU82_28095 [Pseudomonas glycinae]